jgi:hypothetical protein
MVCDPPQQQTQGERPEARESRPGLLANLFCTQLPIKCDEFKAYFRALRLPSSRDKPKFLLLAGYRSGSTLLAGLLNCHPAIFCDGEIFLKFCKHHPDSRFSPLFAKLLSPPFYIKGCVDFSQSNTWYGFDLKISQLEKVHFEPLHGALHEQLSDLHRDNWRIIYLRRDNLYRQAVSNLLARSRNRWSANQSATFSLLRIEPRDLLNELIWFEKQAILEQNALQYLPHLTVLYERDLRQAGNHQVAADKVFRYLGLDSFPVQTSLHRTTAESLADDIQNYDEIVSFIGQTKYAHYLEP